MNDALFSYYLELNDSKLKSNTLKKIGHRFKFEQKVFLSNTLIVCPLSMCIDRLCYTINLKTRNICPDCPAFSRGRG